MNPALRRPMRWLALLLAALVLTGVFALYLRPDFMLDLANQLWSCF